MLEGGRFAVYTDYKPLTNALMQVSELWTTRQQRHLAYVAEYTSDLRHIAGVANIVTDTLSHSPLGASMAASQPPGRVNAPTGSQPASSAAGPLMTVSTTVDYCWLAKEMRDCAAMQAAVTSSLLTVQSFEVEGVPLLCDISSGAVRPLPQPCCQVFFSGHTFHCTSWRAGFQVYGRKPFCMARHGGRCRRLVQGLPGLCPREDDGP
jgi:hypothetical protein